MYSSALCPQCGAAIYGNASGTIVTQCNACPWSGPATFHYIPNGYIPPSVFANIPNIKQLAGIQTPQPFQSLFLSDLEEEMQDPLAARKERAHHHLALMTADVMNRVFALGADDRNGADGWETPQWVRYQRLQEAHAALFDALGGRRMGEYRVDSQRVQTALVEVLFQQLLLLDGALEGPDRPTAPAHGKGR